MSRHDRLLMLGAILWLPLSVLRAEGFTLTVGGDRKTQDRYVAQNLTFEDSAWGLLEFQYQFIQDGGAELMIYLSRDPNIDEGLLEPIAQLTAPDDERLGSPDSNDMSLFRAEVWISGYDPGTDLSLVFALQGHDTSCRIQPSHEWDYNGSVYLTVAGMDIGCGVSCGFTCGDFNGDNVVTELDYLLLVANSGRAMDWSAPCLDMSGDGFVDLIDLLAADMVYHKLNICGTDSWNGRSGLDGKNDSGRESYGYWLAAGKSGREGDQSDGLFELDCNGLGLSEPLAPPLLDEDDIPRGYGRLVQDGRGGLYQLHSVYGLVDLYSKTVVIPGQMATWQGRSVRVGVVDQQGKGLLDVAFDPCDPNVVYVVPVQVWSPLSRCAYNAAARLVLDGNEPYRVTQVYGFDPMEDPNVTVTIYGCGDILLEPDVQRLRELELDNHGNLFVTSSQQLNDNDWVLVYDVNEGNASERRFCISEVMEGPGATLLSASGQSLYLASSIETGPGSSPTVVRYTIERAGQRVVGLTPDAQSLLMLPSDALGANGYALVTSLAAGPQGQVTAFGFAAQRWDGGEPPIHDNRLLTQPFMGSFAGEMPEAVSTVMITHTEMALPLTGTWMSGND